MSKRLYYTCPIKALYMMKNFGVELFILPNSIDLRIAGKEFPFRWISSPEFYKDFLKLTDGMFYITKESEHIFEPKEGDRGIANEDGKCFVKFWKKDKWRDVDFGKVRGKVEIIFRDKNFFDCEVEGE